MFLILVKGIILPLIRNSVENFSAVSTIKIIAFIYFLLIAFFAGTNIGNLGTFSQNAVILLFFFFDLVLKLATPISFRLPFQFIYLPTPKKNLVNYFILANLVFSPFILLSLLFWLGYFSNQQVPDMKDVIYILTITSSSTLLSISLKANLKSINGITLLAVYVISTYYLLQFSIQLLVVIICTGFIMYLGYLHTFKEILKSIAVDYFNLSTQSTFIDKAVSRITTPLLALDTKLVIRSRRPMTYLFISLMYIFIFFSMLFEIPSTSPFFGFIVAGITSLVTMQYSQFIFCWESSFFDFYFINSNSKTIVETKYSVLRVFLLINSLIVLILISISELASFQTIFLTSLIVLFHATVTIPLIVFIGFFQTKKINLEKGAFLNYEGTSGAVFAIIFVSVLPLGLLYFVFNYLKILEYFPWVLTTISCLSLLLSEKVKRLLVKLMDKYYKYLLLQNFNS